MNAVVQTILEKAKRASSLVHLLGFEKKNTFISHLQNLLMLHEEAIIAENKKDLDVMDDANPKKDRLMLNKARIEGLCQALSDVAKLDDPTQKVLSKQNMSNGLEITKISVPIGVIGIIYESRPNVTIDVAALCIKSSNVAVLRGGTDAQFTNLILVKIIQEALQKADISTDMVQILPTDRGHIKDILEATEYIDLIIPRGGQDLIDFVRQNAKVPTIETGAGVCHTYISEYADVEKAAQVSTNAKVTRPSVCNALDTVIVHQKVGIDFYQKLSILMSKFEVGIYADEASFLKLKDFYPHHLLHLADETSFGKEYLSLNFSIKTVSSLEEALEHIQKHSSRHSEAIISENEDECQLFLNQVDAAAVYANASTRFTDGGCFGLGAEIGISTQKLHARGPFALEKLVTEKWIVKGNGQIR